MKLQNILIILAGFIIVFASCNREEIIQDPVDPTPKETSMNDLQIPEGFDFNTSHPLSITIKVLTAQDLPMVDVPLRLMSASTEENGKLLASGTTDKSGVISFNREIPDYTQELVVETDYLGLPSETAVNVSGMEQIGITIGGSRAGIMKSSSIPFKTTDATFVPMGTYNSVGLPDYLENPGDVVDQEFLNDVNASFPESRPVPTYNPEYLDPDNNYDFLLTEACDVWITFVHEGAGYKNVLGYYTFPIDQPPTSPDNIETVNVIFPNISFQGSGGALQTGDKVYLGQFPANTGIGWVLIANGFSSGGINTNNPIYYSNPDLNPESAANKRQHVVTLVDNGRDIFLIGFEDLPREGHSDDDFNDAMFYVTANPITSVDQSGYPPVTYTEDDADEDGVSDNFDDYPNDPDRAFNNYYPQEGVWGTLAYEDLWPSKGDYDFNDMIVDYNINQITNADNEVVEIYADFRLRAAGAGFKNGFGFQLDVTPSQIASVTGVQLTEDLVSLNSNNTESGQTKAVVMVFDNSFKVLSHPGSGTIGVNTTPGSMSVDPETININILFNSPVALADIGIPPYNPFIFANQTRGREVHLPGKVPTDQADANLFGTRNDDTNPASGKYYQTENNLPWAIHITEEFDYPIEKTAIIDAYNFFGIWAESDGSQYPDWFKNQSGYRNTNNIY
jgi:LruC domain-containing protein